ncbi:MAG: hypothetical protein EBS33_04300, partial [Alphaproteobacteria bacterium]|nr:hypothetical protein [Alphaproteobacteria bacterium]
MLNDEQKRRLQLLQQQNNPNIISPVRKIATAQEAGQQLFPTSIPNVAAKPTPTPVGQGIDLVRNITTSLAKDVVGAGKTIGNWFGGNINYLTNQISGKNTAVNNEILKNDLLFQNAINKSKQPLLNPTVKQ